MFYIFNVKVYIWKGVFLIQTAFHTIATAAENKKGLYQKDHLIFIWFHFRSSYMIYFIYIYHRKKFATQSRLNGFPYKSS